jgi:PAS domain S-box-containing protein
LSGPEDALADVIPHDTTDADSPSGARTTALVSLLVAAAAFGVAEWTWWLHPSGIVSTAIAPAAGVLLAALVMFPPRRWPLPVLAAVLALGIAGARHEAPAELVVADALAVASAALATAVLLRWYARDTFHLTRVRELCTLAVAAAVGGVVGAAVRTVGVALLDDRSVGALWKVAWPTAIAIAFGMVLVPVAVVTAVVARTIRMRASIVELVLFVVAVAAVAVAIARVDDPLVFAGSAVLVWGALRVGPASVAWSAVVFVAAADWAAARATGPFTDVASVHDGVTVVQAYAAVVVLGMLLLAFAMEERDSIEEARASAAERFRRTFHDSPVAMAVTTLDGHVVETNRALCALLGVPHYALLGTELRQLRPDDSGEHELPRSTDASGPAETRLVNARGAPVWVEISESPLRRTDAVEPLQVVVLRDVTERTTLRQQLLQAQKMESVGRLAGGIAHDFNNVLSVMRGQVELLHDDLDVLESARKRIDSVQRATDRAAALTDDLMAFSRQRVDEPEPFDLNGRLRDVQELLHQVLGTSVTLDLDLSAAPAIVVADPNRIEQAVLNLVVNARDAMPTGGQVTVTTRIDSAARSVVLSVIDTGAGMDAATRARIFEPFFTTKPPGFGTGLGLSTTDDIVRAAGGTIDVESEPGRGTTFVVRFPAVDDRTGPHDVLDLADEDTPTVLVVDDEAEVRALIAEVLRGSGYHVVVAPDGDAAIALLERAARPVDLLVTDVVMPVMSGTDLAARVTTASPSTRVLFVSGFVPAGSPSLRGAPLVAKPLHRAELLDAVQGVLTGAA